MHLEAPRMLVLPGREQALRLTLRSRLDRKTVARLQLRPVHNLELRDRSVTVPLGPRGSAEVTVRLCAPTAGACALEARVTAAVGRRKVQTKAFALSALACGPTDLKATVGESTCVLCGGHLAVYVSRRNGHMDVHHRLRGGRAQRLHLNPPLIGPPFSWSDLFRVPAEAWVEEGEGTVQLFLRTGSVSRPGLTVTRRIRLDRSPLVEVADTVTNGTKGTVDVGRRQFVRLSGRLGARFSAPLAGGLFTDVEAPGGRGIRGLNPPDREEHWHEGWQACSGRDGVVSAVLWDRADVADMEDGYLEQAGGRVAPGCSATLPPVHLLVSDGDEHTARSWWQLLHGELIDERDQLPEPGREPVELTLTPEPLVVSGAARTARLSLQHPGRYRLQGRVEIGGDETVRVDVRRLDVTDLHADTPVQRQVQVRRRRQRGGAPAGEVSLRFDSGETEYRSRARVLLLDPRARAVEVTKEDGLYRIDNGILSVGVAPAHMGAMTSLVRCGQEYLISSYPKVGQRHWRNPWHGGLHPAYHSHLWGRLHNERFRGRVVERRGTQGLA